MPSNDSPEIRSVKDDTVKKASAIAVQASDGSQRHFDLEDPILPNWISTAAFGSGRYPYSEAMGEHDYEKQLIRLQTELVKLQYWAVDSGRRIVILVEGRDAAGKGGIINAFCEYMNPRLMHVVALPKPNEHERGQWYFQRYVTHLPSPGEIVLFDRSWYNRAGVEKVMGFVSENDAELFLRQAPRFEAMMTEDGIALVKIFVDVGFEMQLSRFHERRHNPLKVWKISSIDREAISRYHEYGAARDRMLETTHSDVAPWVVVMANDKKRARLSAIRHVLGLFDYPGKDRKAIGQVDDKILGLGPAFALKFG